MLPWYCINAQAPLIDQYKGGPIPLSGRTSAQHPAKAATAISRYSPGSRIIIVIRRRRTLIIIMICVTIQYNIIQEHVRHGKASASSTGHHHNLLFVYHIYIYIYIHIYIYIYIVWFIVVWLCNDTWCSQLASKRIVRLEACHTCCERSACQIRGRRYMQRPNVVAAYLRSSSPVH